MAGTVGAGIGTEGFTGAGTVVVAGGETTTDLEGLFAVAGAATTGVATTGDGAAVLAAGDGVTALITGDGVTTGGLSPLGGGFATTGESDAVVVAGLSGTVSNGVTEGVGVGGFAAGAVATTGGTGATRGASRRRRWPMRRVYGSPIAFQSAISR